ncbi:MAG TPA: ParB/RepB/Spo0J family partition protein [Polyangia bacterium]|nr:ParB/RepB/Spo0J family partition protein [Polyangia bacterium]
MTRKVLGRGLSALIPEPPRAATQALPASAIPLRREYLRVAIEDVHPATDQPRRHFDEAALQALVDSIRRDGLLQPLLVRQRSAGAAGTDGAAAGFVIIAGERRWRAAQRAGLQEVPVIVRESTAREAFELALVENLQREDLNPIEEAEAYQRLLEEHGMTQEQMAERVGKDRSTVANALRLLKLPAPVRLLVERGELSMGQARALLGLESAERMAAAARRIVASGLSVRQVEALVRRARVGGGAGRAGQPPSASVRDLSERLQRALGTRVRVVDQGGKGKIEVDWSSLDELDRLLEILLGART